MTVRKLVWLTGIVLTSVVTVSAASESIVDCQVSRITVPVLEKDGKVVCAASFMYGEYVKNPQTQADLLNSKDLIDKLNQLPEESRWEFPEYVVIRHFQEWKAGNKEGVLSCFAPGYSRDKKGSTYKEMSEEERSFWEPFTEVVFLDKSYFGPYVRIYGVVSESVTPAPNEKKIRGLAGVKYLKRVGNRYFLTKEIDMTHIFDPIAGGYGAKKTMFRKKILLNPDTTGLDWFAIDVDINSPPEKKKMLRVFSMEKQPKIPKSFSKNYIKVYVKCEPVNIQLTAGKRLENLSDAMRFIESAVNKHQFGTEPEIMELWEEKSKGSIRREIEMLKNAGEWPKTRPSLLGPAPVVLALMRTSKGTVAYYNRQVLPLDDPYLPVGIVRPKPKTYSIGIRTDASGEHSLFNASAEGTFNVLTNEMFRDAVQELYGQHR
jgi:hypothetical protein